MPLRPNGHGQHHTSDFFYPVLMNLQAKRCAPNSSPLCVWGRDVGQRHIDKHWYGQNYAY